MAKYGLALSLTLTRIPVGIAAATALGSGRLGLCAVLAVAFAVLDVVDGMWARLFDADGPVRRTLDVLVDRVFIHVVILSACLTLDAGWTVWLLLLARDLVLAVFAGVMMARSRLVVIGAGWHRLYGLTVLAWGVAFLAGRSPSPALSVAVVLIAYVILVDYVRRSKAMAAIQKGTLAHG